MLIVEPACRVLYINYAEGHPLEKTHCQVQRSQLLITMLAGTYKPKPPKQQTKQSTKSSKQQTKRFALYIFIRVHFIFFNSVPLLKEPTHNFFLIPTNVIK